MPRFFVDREPGEEFFLDGENGRHLVRSLRTKPGETLTLCAGTGKDFLCTVLSCTEEGALLRVEESRESRGEPETFVTVCQCWPKGDKLETMVQKCVELGAKAVWPLESRRCVSRPDRKAGERKVQRLQKIALEAAQQSERGAVPRVLPPASLEKALQTAAQEGELLFFYENGRASLRSALQKEGLRERKLFLFIGPEGGFAPEEAQLAETLGARLLSLGPRILRTETAPLAALSAILYEMGEFER